MSPSTPSPAEALARLEILNAQATVPTPPSIASAVSGRFDWEQLPPSTRLTASDLIDRDANQTIIRQILSRTHTESERASFETPQDRRKFNQREAEGRRSAFHPRNRRLRERAKLIVENAPSPTCWRTATHRTTTEVSGIPVKCGSWACAHCSQIKTAELMTEVVERFSDYEHVTVIPLADDESRNRYKNRLNKRKQRTGLDVGALVIPVAGEGFVAVSRFSDHDGERFTLTDAFDLLADALTARSELARLVGAEVSRRRISRPGLAAVRDNPKAIDPSIRTIADKTKQARRLGLIFRAVSASELAELVDKHKGKRSAKASKGGWSFRFANETGADAFVADLERLHGLVNEAELAEGRLDRRSRTAWENDRADSAASEMAFA